MACSGFLVPNGSCFFVGEGGVEDYIGHRIIGYMDGFRHGTVLG